MTIAITKHFVTVGTRRVHYTRAGSGPAICLFHPSPCSAQRMRPQQEIFATRFTALAFDTPGFGLSDKLPLDKPELTDFADAFAETLTALGITRTAVYGNHTGAAIAVEFAARHPGRCAMALADGYPAYSSGAAEDRLKRYLEPIVPKWDGSHLLWLWYRYREQHVFWPWHDHDLAHRADTDVPDADFLHQGVIDLLDAGDDYRIGYAAAFRGRGLDVLPDLKVPVCFTLRPGDSLYKTKSAYPNTGVWLEETPRDPLAATVREMELLSRHIGDVPPPAPDCAALKGRDTPSFVQVSGGEVMVRSMGAFDRGRTPLVMLHAQPGSSALNLELMAKIAAQRPVIAIDLPGHGESAPGSFLDSDDAMLEAIGAPVFDLYAPGSGAWAGLHILPAASQRVRRVVLESPLCLAPLDRGALHEKYPIDVRPELDGTHLIRAWHHVRDQELWWPWFDKRREAIRKVAPRIDPTLLTIRVRECLKQPANYGQAWRTALAYPVAERLAQTIHPMLLLSASSDVFAHCVERAAALRPDAKRVEVADSAASRAAAIEGFLSA